MSWMQFIELVSPRFEELLETRIIAEFNKLRQVGTYSDYVNKFEELRACMLLKNKGCCPEEYLIASFISGLSEEIQSFVRMFKPTTLEQTIELGKNQLQTMEALTKKLKSPTKPFSPNTSSYKKPEYTLPTQSKPTVHNPKIPFKLLTSAKMTSRREQGLCYNCNEKYVPGHKYKQRISYMIMTEEEEGDTQGDDTYLDETAQLGEDCRVMEEVQITIHVLTKVDGSTSMRLKGEVAGHTASILIDSGSTLSIISEKTAQTLGCAVEELKPILVKVANGAKMVCSSRVPGLIWKM